MGDTVNPYDACVCVQRHGKWWCPRHQGPPTMTLDRFPPFCAACYYDIQAEQSERVTAKNDPGPTGQIDEKEGRP